MKKLLAATLMIIATNAFAESAADESIRTLAAKQSACANGGSGCYQAMQANDAATKRLLKDAFVTQPEARRSHEQEVVRDEQVRQRVRQRGY
jgi:hypothetical protein